jgi:hypothetical protein
MSASLGRLTPNEGLLLRELIHCGYRALRVSTSNPICCELEPGAIQSLEVFNVSIMGLSYESSNTRIVYSR